MHSLLFLSPWLFGGVFLLRERALAVLGAVGIELISLCSSTHSLYLVRSQVLQFANLPSAISDLSL